MNDKTNRRSFLNTAMCGAAGAGVAWTLEERILLAALEDGAGQDAPPKPSIAPGSLPCGKIGNVSVSRLFMGSNLIGGWSHSRDLLYMSQLFKAYNTERKIFDSLEIAEQCGINTIIDPGQELIDKYRRERNGKMQTLVCFGVEYDKVKLRDQIKSLVDHGNAMIYTHGEATDRAIMDGKMDTIGLTLDLIHEQGVPAGVGAHSLETPIVCEKNKLPADFYVKTFHMDRYWSATPVQRREEYCWYKPQADDHDGYHDNMWCLDAEKTASFMETVAKPWIAFKVMAAGAIAPQMAFSHAYRNGADFIVAGMFDFQIEDDVKIAIDALRKIDARKRPWCG
jgi:hypothetical protein